MKARLNTWMSLLHPLYKWGDFIKNLLIPLGGTDNVGASSYYVQIDGIRILFDAGVCNAPGSDRLPDFEYLLLNRLSSYADIDAVVLSHAHIDHIGALPYLYQKTGNIPYFATQATKKLSYLQLVTFGNDKAFNDVNLRLLSQNAVDNITECSLFTRYYINKDKENEAYIEFYPAGHCPGAVITKLVTKNHTLVYTGDFNPNINEKINNMRIESLNADILIMNSTKGYVKCNGNTYDAFIHDLADSCKHNEQVAIYSNNIAKLLDIFCCINDKKHIIEAVIDNELMSVVNVFEEMGYPIYSKIIRGKCSKEKDMRVIVTTKPERYPHAKVIDTAKYSLHPDAVMLKEFAEKMRPKEIYLVHSDLSHKSNPNIIDYLVSLENTNVRRIVQCENVNEYEIGVMHC